MKKSCFNGLRAFGLMLVLGTSTLAWNLTAATQLCTLPPGIIPFSIAANQESFTPVTFSGIPAGYSISNGTYRGWCVQYETLIAPGPVYHAGLSDTYGPLPGQLQGIPWERVNYVLNHKRGDAWDVQYVIWYVLGQAISPPANTPQVEMIYDVQAHGQGFVPTNGQIVGVIVEPSEGVQRLIVETIWDARCRDSIAPLAAIASPAPGHPYTNAQTIEIVANATDNVGVTRCEFYNGPTLVSARESAPFRFGWTVTDANNGSYNWTVRAYDYAGNVTISTPLAIQVAIDVVPPVVSLVAPASNSVYTNTQTVLVSADAFDSFGVTRVEFYDQGQLRAISTAAPWTYSWPISAPDNGTHLWTARAYDGAGNTTLSATLSVQVAIDIVPPVVSIVAPAMNSHYTNAQGVLITASASDNFGVARVEFYDQGQLRGVSTSAPWNCNWPINAVDNGTHLWTAQAYDGAGNMTISAVLPVQVAIDIVPPVVSIVSPAANSQYTSAQTVLITASASDSFGVTRVEFYRQGQLRAVSTAAPWTYSWPISAADNGTYVWTAQAYDGAGNTTISAGVSLRVAIDIELPTVTITTPLADSAVSNQIVTITGLATDNVAVGRVELQINDGPFMVASGTTQWSVQVPLTPGTYAVRVRSFDTSGNQSLSATRNFAYFDTSPLTVTQAGAGTIIPNLHGQPLELNQSYQMIAIPELGHVFSNWTGGVASSSPQLTFVMTPNLALRANFAPNVFQPVKGSYAGLFYDTNGVNTHSSGSFEITTTGKGSYSVKLLIGGDRISFTGLFDAESKSHQVIAWKGHGSLTIDLHLYILNGVDYIRGTITGPGWSAVLFGDRQNVTPLAGSAHAGKYTLALPDTTGTRGDGFGTIKLSLKGRLDFTGQLGDGTKLRQKAYVSGDGRWPLYLSLYKKAGSLLGWVNFVPTPETDLSSRVTWLAPGNAGTVAHRQLNLVGSRYSYSIKPPRAALDFNHGVLTLTGGELTQALAMEVGLNNNNKFVDLSGHGLTLKCTVVNGLISGKMVDPQSGKKLTLRGALLQKQNKAFGLFNGMNTIGRVSLGAE